VFSESAIDALSYAVLHPDDSARYASIGGQVNPKQPRLIRKEILRMPAGSAIVSAMDNDAAGRSLSGLIASALEACGRSDLSFVEDLPEPEGADWNDMLKARPPPARSSPRSQSSIRPVAAKNSGPAPRRGWTAKPPGF
jgi:Toprim-like